MLQGMDMYNPAKLNDAQQNRKVVVTMHIK